MVLLAVFSSLLQHCRHVARASSWLQGVQRGRVMPRAISRTGESQSCRITPLPRGLCDCRVWVAALWGWWGPQALGRQRRVILCFVPAGAAQDANSPCVPVPVPAQHSPLDTGEYGFSRLPSMPRKVRGVPPTLGEDGMDGSGWMDVQPRTLSAAGKHKLSFI